MENFGSFLFKFEINIRKTNLLIESTDNKLINAELALLFNETCKNENILPQYTDMKIYKYIHIDIYTSIAHRIKNPLRRTSELITLHDLKH